MSYIIGKDHNGKEELVAVTKEHYSGGTLVRYYWLTTLDGSPVHIQVGKISNAKKWDKKTKDYLDKVCSDSARLVCAKGLMPLFKVY